MTKYDIDFGDVRIDFAYFVSGSSNVKCFIEPIFCFNVPKVPIRLWPPGCSLRGVYLECVDESFDIIDLSCPRSLFSGNNLQIDPVGIFYFILRDWVNANMLFLYLEILTYGEYKKWLECFVVAPKRIYQKWWKEENTLWEDMENMKIYNY